MLLSIVQLVHSALRKPSPRCARPSRKEVEFLLFWPPYDVFPSGSIRLSRFQTIQPSITIQI